MTDENLSTLIKKLDDDLRDLLDRRFDLQFELDVVNDVINEKKMLRMFYKYKLNGDITDVPLSKAKIETLTRGRSKSPPMLRTVEKRRLNYNVKKNEN